MILFSEDRKSFIEIVLIELETERMPGIHVNITVQNEGFAGVHHAWIEVDTINRFLSCMDEMEITRRGKARLCSMSPNDFILDFEAFDKSGHIKVEYSITRYIGHPFVRELSLHGAFLIESSEFPNIVRAFRTLL